MKSTAYISTSRGLLMEFGIIETPRRSRLARLRSWLAWWRR